MNNLIVKSRMGTYAVEEEDRVVPPILGFLCEHVGKVRHEQHEDVGVGVAGGEGNPDLAVGGDRRDDVNLLAERLLGCRVAHAATPPPPTVEVRHRHPGFVDVDDPAAGIVDLEHLLGVEAAKDLVALSVAGEWHPLDLPVP